MRKIPVEQAIGETLCHDMTAILANGFKGVAFKRGHVITKEDIPALLDIGKSHVFVWEPEADEVHEDDAAKAVVHAVCGDNLNFSGPSEGKFTITAASDGIFCINSDALKQINSVPDYTIACIPNFTMVKKDEILCGARIIPLVTKRENVESAVEISKENYPVFSVKPLITLKCGVIITGSEIYYGRIKDKFEPIMRDKLNKLNAEILGVVKCPDNLNMITNAIDDFIKQGARLILLTGGMSVDPDDLTPTAIRQSGAAMVTQGVPIQPGNMLTMAYLNETMLVGVPGASMHSSVTSLDVFLPRIFAGIKISKSDIAGLGEGGLCMGCNECRYPMCYFGKIGGIK